MKNKKKHIQMLEQEKTKLQKKMQDKESGNQRNCGATEKLSLKKTKSYNKNKRLCLQRSNKKE
ncbi:hypothetical protein ACT7C6_30060 [Bacillus paranthracis]